MGAKSFPTCFFPVPGKGASMQLLIWIFVGLAAGWIAGKNLEGKGYGPSMDLAMGVAGAVLGGVLTRAVGFSSYSGTFVATFVAIVCAALFTILAALLNGRTIRARAF
jgi:uncharacterized membrane protein YeaQ/YmgE (transglycosylase-associated protein family)